MLISVGWWLLAEWVTLFDVVDRVRMMLDDQGGIARREELLAVVSRGSVDAAIRREDLRRRYRCTYVDPVCAEETIVARYAALAYANGFAALSHTTALEVWGLPVPANQPIHAITGRTHHLRGAPGLVVHRREGFVCEPPDVVVRAGLPVTRLDRAIVESWPLLDGDAKRAPAIQAVAQRMTTPARLLRQLDLHPRLAGRRLFKDLLQLLACGCRSHLEMWGYRHIFTGPEFASLEWQVPVGVNGRTIYLDALDRETHVNFELDGAKHHMRRRDRERDLRRDAALQALGLLVVRLPHDWMLTDPRGVRAHALAIMAARRR